jgi:GFO/IDH/MocA oxidoreductase family protein
MESTKHDLTTRDLTVGVLGCGDVVTDCWGPNLKGRVRRLLGYDVNPDSAHGFAERFGGELFPSPGALLDEKPDLVIVATPPELHVFGALQAIDAGVRHLVVETPLATRLDEAVGLWRAARDYGVVLDQPFHQDRVMLRPMLDAIDAGSLSAFEYEWLRREPTEANLLEELGPHALAVLLDRLPYEQIESVTTVHEGREWVVTVESPGREISIRLASGVDLAGRDELVGVKMKDRFGRWEADLRTAHTPSPDVLDYRPRFIPQAEPLIVEHPLLPVEPVEAIRARMVAGVLGSVGHVTSRMRQAADRYVKVQALLDAAQISELVGGFASTVAAETIFARTG